MPDKSESTFGEWPKSADSPDWPTPPKPDPERHLKYPWCVGLFVSSSRPDRHVRVIAQGAKEISEYEIRKDFVRWLIPFLWERK